MVHHRTRSWFFTSVLVASLLCALGCSGCRHTPDPEPGELGQWVDPFIGTGGLPWTSGMLFPGATAPFGMVRLSPDTTWPGGLTIGNMATAGYFWGHGLTLGFSHTRLSGTGSTDGGHFRVTPAVGAVDPAVRRTHPLRFAHGDEVASPGYYSVWLPDLGALVELTATTHVGAHRYTFGAGTDAHLLLDATSAIGDGDTSEGRIEVRPSDREVVGQGRVLTGFASRYGGLKGYFVARFSAPFATYGTWIDGELVAGRPSAEGNDVGADLSFAGTGGAGPIVEMKIGVSFVGPENARANLEAEAGPLDFDGIHAAARADWEEALGTIRIETADPTVREIFYTSLYHSMMMPTDFTDTNREYLGFEGQVGVADDFTYRTDLSLWDTFRDEHALLTLIVPEVERDSVKSLVRMARVDGSFPRWPSGGGETGSMFGTPADLVIAETYLKGIADFEVGEAYELMKVTALGPPPAGGTGRDGIEDCIAFGYCPADRMSQAVARTLEYAWADASLAGLAEALGHDEEASFFRERSLNYRNTWNPATRYFQPRNADGTWLEPFLPDLTTYLDDFLFGGKLLDDYVEGSPRQWRWTAPHDPVGLLALFGGPEYFVSELETFMSQASPTRAAAYPGPAYWQGNEHDIHALYLFDEAGRPDLTQKWVRWALTTRYGNGPDGLDGNDDGGATSSWYVLSALGLYPVAGSDRYWVGAPIVDRAEIALGGGRTLVVTAEGQALDRPYVEEAWLDGARLCEPFLLHSQIASGATLAFKMSAAPAPGGGFACLAGPG